MIRPAYLFFTLFIVFIFTTSAYGSHHTTRNHPSTTSKSQIGKSGTQPEKAANSQPGKRQLHAEKTAKTIIEPLKKDHVAQQDRYKNAGEKYTQAKKDFANAKGTNEVVTAGRKLTEAENEYYAARSAHTRATTKYTEAKDKLGKLRKEGWRTFIDNQKKRLDNSGAASVVLPRAQFNDAAPADPLKYSKALMDAEIKHAFSRN